MTDESIGRMAGSFSRLSPMLDEAWLRQTVRGLEAEFGVIPAARVRTAMRATFDYCSRRLPIPYGQTGHVRLPREFARTCVRSEIQRGMMGGRDGRSRGRR